MDTRWFKEDRALPKGEQKEAIASSTKVLQNSTIMSRRLKQILKDLESECVRDDFDFSDTNWSFKAAANASRRKTLQEIYKLLP
jgi:hypothetical protein